MRRIPLKEIVRVVDGRLVGDGAFLISGINALEAAGPGELSFCVSPRYRGRLETTKAGAVLVREETPSFPGPQVVVSNPRLAYARTAALFAPPVPRFPGVSKQAFIHEAARLGANASIYPWVYVGAEAQIEDDVVLFPGVFVGDGGRIGAGSVLYPNVTVLQGCIIGRNVVIHAGTVVGSDGFGFEREGGRAVKIPQMGTVRIDDDVEIGANCCIDRAALGVTWVKRGVKTDNLVQIAHNVVVGEDTLLVAQAGISGSAEIGRGVIIGGQAGIGDHAKIGDGAMIGSQSGVAKSVGPGEVVFGSPTMPHRQWLKMSGALPRLPRMLERLREMERRLSLLEKRGKEESGTHGTSPEL